MIKTGIVMAVDKNKIYLMTGSGEFVKVKSKGNLPSIGEEYTGEVHLEKKFFQRSVLAASIMAFILIASGIFSYFTPVAAITININPSVKFHINFWNKIIRVSPLNSDGEKILEHLNLTNKSSETGVNLIIEEAKKENYINKQYKDSGKVISVHIDTKKISGTLDVSKIETVIKNQNLKFNVTIDNIQEEKKELDKNTNIENNNLQNTDETSKKNDYSFSIDKSTFNKSDKDNSVKKQNNKQYSKTNNNNNKNNFTYNTKKDNNRKSRNSKSENNKK